MTAFLAHTHTTGTLMPISAALTCMACTPLVITAMKALLTLIRTQTLRKGAGLLHLDAMNSDPPPHTSPPPQLASA